MRYEGSATTSPTTRTASHGRRKSERAAELTRLETVSGRSPHAMSGQGVAPLRAARAVRSALKGRCRSRPTSYARHAPADLETVLLRQLDVEEDQVEGVEGALLAGHSVPLGHDLVAFALER